MTERNDRAEVVHDDSPIVLSLEAARIERAVRSARIAEAMNFVEPQVRNDQITVQVAERPTWVKAVRAVSVVAGLAAMPTFIVPFIAGPAWIALPIGLITAFLVGIVATNPVNIVRHSGDYIGP